MVSNLHEVRDPWNVRTLGTKIIASIFLEIKNGKIIFFFLTRFSFKGIRRRRWHVAAERQPLSTGGM